MKRSAVVILIGVLCFAFESAAGDARYTKAEIYYINWGALTRGKLTLEHVRKNAMIKTTIVDEHEAMALGKWLRLDNMRKAQPDRAKNADPRLVIDLWDASGNRSTFYSGGSMLISEDGLQWRGVNKEFLQKFTFARKW